MPYRPETRIIRHGLADVKFRPPNMDYEGWKEISDRFIAEREKQYKETQDLYDIQAEQANELNSVLQGTSGKDYEYLQSSIVSSRNRLKDLYKGKTLKETKTPQFQTELYNIRQDLMNKRNSIDTFYGQVKSANDIAMNTPSIRRKEWQDYLNGQMQLPPDSRDSNLINRINTDPLFFNPYDHASGMIEKEGKDRALYMEETKDLITNYQAEYRPSLGRFENNQWVAEPSNEFVDRLLKSDRRFYNAMAGMLPAEQANTLIATGNTSTTFPQSVRDVTKTYIKTIQGFAPERKQLSSKMKYHDRPTATDKKLAAEEEELRVIQERLQTGDARSFDDFLGDFWTDFKFDYENDGTTIKGIIGKHKAKNQRGREIEVIETMDVDPSDEGSVKQAINRIKAFQNKNKQNVKVKPLGSQNKAFTAPDGKTYTIADLRKLGYTDERIQAAVSSGTLKEK